MKLISNKIQLSINGENIGAIPLNQHLNNYFDLFIRDINKKNIPELLSESNVYFTINDKKSLAKELKSYLNIAIVDENAKTIEISYDYFNARLVL